MVAGSRKFAGPKGVGEVYRADPADPPPFPTEQSQSPVAQAAPPAGHPPSHSPEFAYRNPIAPTDQPTFIPTQKPRVQSPEERFARIALWLGVVSIFAFGPILGPIAMLLGSMSIRRGEKKLGRLAIIFGLLGTVLGVLFAVLVAKGVLPSVDELLDDIRKQNQK